MILARSERESWYQPGFVSDGQVYAVPTNSFLNIIPVRAGCVRVCMCVYKGIKLTNFKIDFIEV